MLEEKNHNHTQEDIELLAEQELEKAEISSFDESFKPTVLSEEEKKRPVKPIVEYLSEKEKKLRGNDKLINIIPTPLRSDYTAPTLMATGYASADYKNFYSVGHFPKLGIFEVWHHNEKKRCKSNKKENSSEENINALI